VKEKPSRVRTTICAGILVWGRFWRPIGEHWSWPKGVTC